MRSKRRNKTLRVFGPYELKVVKQNHGGGREIDVKRSKQNLAEQTKEWAPDLKGKNKRKNGIYVYALRKQGKGAPVPFYVGITRKRGLLDEAFYSHKKDHYNRALGKSSGTPCLYFITSPDPNKNKLGAQMLEYWEQILIYLAYSNNPKLGNKAFRPKTLRVKGLRLLHHQDHEKGEANGKGAKHLNKMFRLD